MIRIMLVDDHALVRCGIQRLLRDIEGMAVVAEAESGEKAIELAKRHAPEVVLMDVSMPGMGGLEATRRLLQFDPGIKLIVVTAHANDLYPTRFLKAGAFGYLSKGCSVQEIVEAIRTVHKGQRYLASDIAMQVAISSVSPKEGRSPFESLSQRELQVMMMVTQGRKTQDISDQLSLSPKTVATYRSRVLAKLGVQSDVELTHLAMRHGVIPGNR